jgi:hypothetical protein
MANIRIYNEPTRLKVSRDNIDVFYIDKQDENYNITADVYADNETVVITDNGSIVLQEFFNNFLIPLGNSVREVVCQIEEWIQDVPPPPPVPGSRPELADDCSVTNVPASLSEVSLIAENTLRREVIIHNNSNGILYVICGGGVTPTNYNWRLRRGDHLSVDSFRGELKGIFTNATGFAMVTEYFYT